MGSSHQENINDDIVKLTRECGLEGLTANDVTELLDVQDQPLTNQELEELIEDHPLSENLEDEGESDGKILKTSDW